MISNNKIYCYCHFLVHFYCSSKIISIEFLQLVSWHSPHIAEQCIANCVNLHLLLHATLQLHEPRFRSLKAAASLVVGTGLKEFSVIDQPQLVGSRQLPSNSWTWRYTLYECCSAAALVGGKEASWKNILNLFFCNCFVIHEISELI